MTKQKKIGEQHTKNVCAALKDTLANHNISSYSRPVQLTVQYIINKYPTIEAVKGKYDCTNPDDVPDLQLILATDEVVAINLFSLQKRTKIQPKNLGIKSFMKKYFHAAETQRKFNLIVDKYYTDFLQAIIDTQEEVKACKLENTLKKRVELLYPSFTAEINPMRTSLLFHLREELFELLLQENAISTSGLEVGVKQLLLADSVTFITYYGEGDTDKVVEQWCPELQMTEKVQLYKKGNDTVGIRIGQTGLTLRLKFESSPTSSLKLATSFDQFPIENEREQINKQSLIKLNKILERPAICNTKKTEPNAAGKCNEALVYAGFVEKYQAIYQVNATEYLNLLEAHAPKVKEQTMSYLQGAASVTVDEIEKYLVSKYTSYELESIQLVPQSYVKNKLDTADLQLTLKVHGCPVTAEFSLKAMAKIGGQVTMKNPGIGTILGIQYFDTGTMADVVNEVKAKYDYQQLTHSESLEEVSKQLGMRLQSAPQKNLKKGLAALFGTAPTVVTFYEAKQCVIKEHDQITSAVHVYPQTPTPLNTKITWGNGEDEIKLRMKFSKGQEHGWSSLKLACEYRVELT